jgi:hypothetical protein
MEEKQVDRGKRRKALLAILLVFILLFGGGLFLLLNRPIAIQFNSRGGEEIKSISVKRGANRQLDVPVFPGHTFTGWSTAIGSTDIIHNTSKISRATTLVANWRQNEYQIAFHSEGQLIQTMNFHFEGREGRTYSDVTVTTGERRTRAFYEDRQYFVLDPARHNQFAHQQFLGWSFVDLNGVTMELTFEGHTAGATITGNPSFGDGTWYLGKQGEVDAQGNRVRTPIGGAGANPVTFTPSLYDTTYHAIWQYRGGQGAAQANRARITFLPQRPAGNSFSGAIFEELVGYGTEFTSPFIGLETLANGFIGWRIHTSNTANNVIRTSTGGTIFNNADAPANTRALTVSQLQDINRIADTVFRPGDEIFLDPLMGYLSLANTQLGGRNIVFYPEFATNPNQMLLDSNLRPLSEHGSRGITTSATRDQIVFDVNMFDEDRNPYYRFVGWKYYVNKRMPVSNPSNPANTLTRFEITRPEGASGLVRDRFIGNGATPSRVTLPSSVPGIHFIQSSEILGTTPTSGEVDATIFYEMWEPREASVIFNFRDMTQPANKTRLITSVKFGCRFTSNTTDYSRLFSGTPFSEIAGTGVRLDGLRYMATTNIDGTIRLPEGSKFIVANKSFVGWREPARGDIPGRVFPAGYLYTIPTGFTTDFEMEAVWADNYTFRFDLRGGSFSGDISEGVGSDGRRYVQINAGDFHRFGYWFEGITTSYTGAEVFGTTATNRIIRYTPIAGQPFTMEAQWTARQVGIDLEFSYQRFNSDTNTAEDVGGVMRLTQHQDGTPLLYNESIRLSAVTNANNEIAYMINSSGERVAVNDANRTAASLMAADFNEIMTLVAWEVAMLADTPIAELVSGGPSEHIVLSENMDFTYQNGNPVNRTSTSYVPVANRTSMFANATNISAAKTIEVTVFNGGLGIREHVAYNPSEPQPFKYEDYVDRIHPNMLLSHTFIGFFELPKSLMEGNRQETTPDGINSFINNHPTDVTLSNGMFGPRPFPHPVTGVEQGFGDIHEFINGTVSIPIRQATHLHMILKPNAVDIVYLAEDFGEVDAVNDGIAGTVASFFGDEFGARVNLERGTEQFKPTSGRFLGWTIEYYTQEFEDVVAEDSVILPFHSYRAMVDGDGRVIESEYLHLMTALSDGNTPVRTIILRPFVLEPNQYLLQLVDDQGFATGIPGTTRDNQHEFIIDGITLNGAAFQSGTLDLTLVTLNDMLGEMFFNNLRGNSNQIIGFSTTPHGQAGIQYNVGAIYNLTTSAGTSSLIAFDMSNPIIRLYLVCNPIEYTVIVYSGTEHGGSFNHVSNELFTFDNIIRPDARFGRAGTSLDLPGSAEINAELAGKGITNNGHFINYNLNVFNYSPSSPNRDLPAGHTTYVGIAGTFAQHIDVREADADNVIRLFLVWQPAPVQIQYIDYRNHSAGDVVGDVQNNLRFGGEIKLHDRESSFVPNQLGLNFVGWVLMNTAGTQSIASFDFDNFGVAPTITLTWELLQHGVQCPLDPNRIVLILEPNFTRDQANVQFNLHGPDGNQHAAYRGNPDDPMFSYFSGGSVATYSNVLFGSAIDVDTNFDNFVGSPTWTLVGGSWENVWDINTSGVLFDGWYTFIGEHPFFDHVPVEAQKRKNLEITSTGQIILDFVPDSGFNGTIVIYAAWTPVVPFELFDLRLKNSDGETNYAEEIVYTVTHTGTGTIAPFYVENDDNGYRALAVNEVGATFDNGHRIISVIIPLNHSEIQAGGVSVGDKLVRWETRSTAVETMQVDMDEASRLIGYFRDQLRSNLIPTYRDVGFGFDVSNAINNYNGTHIRNGFELVGFATSDFHNNQVGHVIIDNFTEHTPDAKIRYERAVAIGRTPQRIILIPIYRARTFTIEFNTFPEDIFPSMMQRPTARFENLTNAFDFNVDNVATTGRMSIEVEFGQELNLPFAILERDNPYRTDLRRMVGWQYWSGGQAMRPNSMLHSTREVPTGHDARFHQSFLRNTTLTTPFPFPSDGIVSAEGDWEGAYAEMRIKFYAQFADRPDEIQEIWFNDAQQTSHGFTNWTQGDANRMVSMPLIPDYSNNLYRATDGFRTTNGESFMFHGNNGITTYQIPKINSDLDSSFANVSNNLRRVGNRDVTGMRPVEWHRLVAGTANQDMVLDSDVYTRFSLGLDNSTRIRTLDGQLSERDFEIAPNNAPLVHVSFILVYDWAEGNLQFSKNNGNVDWSSDFIASRATLENVNSPDAITEGYRFNEFVALPLSTDIISRTTSQFLRGWSKSDASEHSADILSGLMWGTMTRADVEAFNAGEIDSLRTDFYFDCDCVVDFDFFGECEDCDDATRLNRQKKKLMPILIFDATLNDGDGAYVPVTSQHLRNGDYVFVRDTQTIAIWNEDGQNFDLDSNNPRAARIAAEGSDNWIYPTGSIGAYVFDTFNTANPFAVGTTTLHAVWSATPRRDHQPITVNFFYGGLDGDVFYNLSTPIDSDNVDNFSEFTDLTFYLNINFGASCGCNTWYPDFDEPCNPATCSALPIPYVPNFPFVRWDLVVPCEDATDGFRVYRDIGTGVTKFESIHQDENNHINLVAVFSADFPAVNVIYHNGGTESEQNHSLDAEILRNGTLFLNLPFGESRDRVQGTNDLPGRSEFPNLLRWETIDGIPLGAAENFPAGTVFIDRLTDGTDYTPDHVCRAGCDFHGNNTVHLFAIFEDSRCMDPIEIRFFDRDDVAGADVLINLDYPRITNTAHVLGVLTPNPFYLDVRFGEPVYRVECNMCDEEKINGTLRTPHKRPADTSSVYNFIGWNVRLPGNSVGVPVSGINAFTSAHLIDGRIEVVAVWEREEICNAFLVDVVFHNGGTTGDFNLTRPNRVNGLPDGRLYINVQVGSGHNPGTACGVSGCNQDHRNNGLPHPDAPENHEFSHWETTRGDSQSSFSTGTVMEVVGPSTVFLPRNLHTDGKLHLVAIFVKLPDAEHITITYYEDDTRASVIDIQNGYTYTGTPGNRISGGGRLIGPDANGVMPSDGMRYGVMIQDDRYIFNIPTNRSFLGWRVIAGPSNMMGRVFYPGDFLPGGLAQNIEFVPYYVDQYASWRGDIIGSSATAFRDFWMNQNVSHNEIVALPRTITSADFETVWEVPSGIKTIVFPRLPSGRTVTIPTGSIVSEEVIRVVFPEGFEFGTSRYTVHAQSITAPLMRTMYIGDRLIGDGGEGRVGNIIGGSATVDPDTGEITLNSALESYRVAQGQLPEYSSDAFPEQFEGRTVKYYYSHNINLFGALYSPCRTVLLAHPGRMAMAPGSTPSELQVVKSYALSFMMDTGTVSLNRASTGQSNINMIEPNAFFHSNASTLGMPIVRADQISMNSVGGYHPHLRNVAEGRTSQLIQPADRGWHFTNGILYNENGFHTIMYVSTTAVGENETRMVIASSVIDIASYALSSFYRAGANAGRRERSTNDRATINELIIYAQTNVGLGMFGYGDASLMPYRGAIDRLVLGSPVASFDANIGDGWTSLQMLRLEGLNTPLLNARTVAGNPETRFMESSLIPSTFPIYVPTDNNGFITTVYNTTTTDRRGDWSHFFRRNAQGNNRVQAEIKTIHWEFVPGADQITGTRLMSSVIEFPSERTAREHFEDPSKVFIGWELTIPNASPADVRLYSPEMVRTISMVNEYINSPSDFWTRPADGMYDAGISGRQEGGIYIQDVVIIKALWDEPMFNFIDASVPANGSTDLNYVGLRVQVREPNGTVRFATGREQSRRFSNAADNLQFLLPAHTHRIGVSRPGAFVGWIQRANGDGLPRAITMESENMDMWEGSRWNWNDPANLDGRIIPDGRSANATFMPNSDQTLTFYALYDTSTTNIAYSVRILGNADSGTVEARAANAPDNTTHAENFFIPAAVRMSNAMDSAGYMYRVTHIAPNGFRNASIRRLEIGGFVEMIGESAFERTSNATSISDISTATTNGSYDLVFKHSNQLGATVTAGRFLGINAPIFDLGTPRVDDFIHVGRLFLQGTQAEHDEYMWSGDPCNCIWLNNVYLRWNGREFVYDYALTLTMRNHSHHFDYPGIEMMNRALNHPEIGKMHNEGDLIRNAYDLYQVEINDGVRTARQIAVYNNTGSFITVDAAHASAEAMFEGTANTSNPYQLPVYTRVFSDTTNGGIETFYRTELIDGQVVTNRTSTNRHRTEFAPLFGAPLLDVWRWEENVEGLNRSITLYDRYILLTREANRGRPAWYRHTGREYVVDELMSGVSSGHATNLVIGNGAFAYSGVGGDVDFPTITSRIGRSAFLQCSNLDRVAFVNPTESKLTAIGQSAFAFSGISGQFNIPRAVGQNGLAPNNGVSNGIGNFAFAGTKISSFAIPGGPTDKASRLEGADLIPLDGQHMVNTYVTSSEGHLLLRQFHTLTLVKFAPGYTGPGGNVSNARITATATATDSIAHYGTVVNVAFIQSLLSPATPDYRVNRVGVGAFAFNTSVNTLIIPQGVMADERIAEGSSGTLRNIIIGLPGQTPPPSSLQNMGSGWPITSSAFAGVICSIHVPAETLATWKQEVRHQPHHTVMHAHRADYQFVHPRV